MTARAIEVRVLGDAYQLEAALGKASKLLAQFGGDANAAADAQIQAGVRSREDLKKLAAAYEQTAAAAAKGSDEQIVASQKAAEANARLARLNQESAAKNVKAADESAAAWKRSSAGVIGFAKQAAFFGAGYLGFEGLKSSLDAVLGAQTSIAQRNQALKDAHANVQALLPILERYEQLARERGFTDDQTRQAEEELITAFGATKHSLGELVVAENLARKSREDLGTATKGLILLQEGNTRAAKQYGLAIPDLSKQTWEQKAAQDGLTISQEKGKVLYDELLPRIKGQSAAFAATPTGKMAEFHAEIQKLEESIGQGLLPAADHYLTVADAWLSKSANQKQITHDVSIAVHDLAGFLHDAYKAGEEVLNVASPLVHAFGGWKTVLELIVGLKFASVISGWTSEITAFTGAQGAGGLLGAESAAGGLLGKLRALSASPFVITTLVMNARDPAAMGIKTYQDFKNLPAEEQRFLRSQGVTQAMINKLPGGPASAHGGAHGGSENQRIVAAGKAFGGTGGGTYESGGGHTSGRVKVGSALDCSGFIYQSLLAAGVKGFSNGNAASQFQQLKSGGAGNWIATEPGLNNAQPGDLVYWNNGTSEPQPAHCGIVVSGRGAGSKAMQYEDPKDGSGIGPINEYPIYGIFRVKIIKGGAAGGSGGSPYGPSTAGQAGSRSDNAALAGAVKAITGSNLISEAVRNMIAGAADHAKTAHGAAAIRWLNTELHDLELAKEQLDRKLKDSSGTQRAAIQAELRTVDSSIATVQKEVASAASSWAKSMLSQIQSNADSAFQRATNAHIQNVLMPRYFQGVDAQGNKRLTPAEAQLAAMQAEDTTNQLQQALAQAQASGDPAAIAAAQRAITENNLATEATKERAKADADYAKAVKKYEAERTQREKALNASLLKFTENLAKGSVAIGGLAKVLERFGLPGDTVALPALGGGHHVRVHVPHHHGHRGHHRHHALTGGGPAPQPPAGGHGGGMQLILEIDGRRLASALAPRTDQVTRLKLS